MSNDIVVVAQCRTPVGRFGGILSEKTALELATIVIKELFSRADVKPGEIDEIIMGNVENRTDETCIARFAALTAGIPYTAPAYVVNRLCGSSMQAIHSAAGSIMLGRSSVAIAGGVENMSRYRYGVSEARFGCRMGDTTFEDMLVQSLTDQKEKKHIAYTAENLAVKYGISREQQDEQACLSHQKAALARDAGKFTDEIVLLNVKRGKEETVFMNDEGIRDNINPEKIAKMRPLFPEGSVTAANASGINDGASAMLLMSEQYAKSKGLKPLAYLRATASIGCPPEIMGIGPVPAIKKILNQTGLSLDQIDLFEINEAFAVQLLSVIKELDLDSSIINVNGGAIALGHAVGNSGTRISITLLQEMRRRQARFGISTMCIGGGQGIATLWEVAD